MLIFRKISSTLYGISVFAFIAFIITYFSGLGISDLISAVIILMYLIGIKFDLLADLLESRKPFSERIGKAILALDWFLSALLLFSGLFYLFFSDVTFGAPLTTGGLIATILSAKILRLNKLLKQKPLKHKRKKTNGYTKGSSG